MTEKENLIAWIKTFARKVRGEHERFIVDEISTEYYFLLDCTSVEEPEKYPETIGKCDVYLVPLRAVDWESDKMRLVDNANRHGVMRLFAAIGVHKLSDKTRAAFYELSNPLRQPHAPLRPCRPRFGKMNHENENRMPMLEPERGGRDD